MTKLALTLGLAAAVSMLAACENLKPIGSRGGASTGGAASVGPAAKDAVKLEMYIMSKCPYGVQAVQGIKPALDLLGNKVDFRLDYIANENNGQFGSLHGPPEVKGDIQQLCAMKHYPDRAKWMGFIDCVNKNWTGIPEGWEPCAAQAGMDKGKLASCIDGNEGKDLLRESMKRAQGANAGGSPTIVLAGAPYEGGREKNDFIRGICGKLTGAKPTVCTNIPEDIEVVATVLTDKRCKACQTAGLEANLKARFFPKLKVKTVDYGDAEGKELYKTLAADGYNMLPLMLFGQGVEKAERYNSISRWMAEVGDKKWKVLKIPAQFDPTAEICDNKSDDNGDGKVDCADPTCEEDQNCRKEIPGKLSVFIMSQCPFGTEAVNAIKEVQENFKNKLKFDVHFIVDKAKGGFTSMHGPAEVDENLREACAQKHYQKGGKWLEYFWCRNKNIQSPDWKSCATGGISADVIEKCSTGDEGKKILEKDIKITKALQISGSPTWLANNKNKFSARGPESIKTEICKFNKDLPNCDKTLSGPPAQAGGGGGGGSCGGH
jgi:protein-disulfide isomerase